MRTFGNERDRLARALTSLLAADEPALGETDARRVLQYRDTVLSNLTSISDEVLGGAPFVKPTLRAVSAAPARALRTSLHALPRTGDPAAPSDVFAAAPRSVYALTWQAAARASLLAADTLAMGQPTGWRADPDAAWSVMADTSAAAHALAVLDRRLATHPNEHFDDRARDALHATWRTGLRLVASEVSRLAHSQPLGSGADHLVRPPGLSPFPVTDLESLIAGYQHAHRILQARDGVLPIRVLGHVLVAEARIGHTLADHCERAHAGVTGADALANIWREHANTAETLDRHRRAVGGLHPGTRHPALAQLGEVLRGVQRRAAVRRSPEGASGLTTAEALSSTAAHLERTLAGGIQRAFARDLYLVPNEHTSKRRGRLPWVSTRQGTEEHPLLAAARSTYTSPIAAPGPTGGDRGPVPRARDELQCAIHRVEPPRAGPPAMTQR